MFDIHVIRLPASAVLSDASVQLRNSQGVSPNTGSVPFLLSTAMQQRRPDPSSTYFNGRKAAASHQRISLLGNGNGLKLGIAVSIRSGPFVSMHSVERDPQVAIVNATSVHR
ncbi:MAG: hypothetical protein ACE5NW_17490, partial [Acidiferrobacterales bacterium]